MKRAIENAPPFNPVDVRILRKPGWDLLILNRIRHPLRRVTIDSRPKTPKTILKSVRSGVQTEPRKRVRFEPRLDINELANVRFS